MTMLEIYKGRKDTLTARIRESKSLYETQSVITELFDTMKYQYLARAGNEGMTQDVTEVIEVATSVFPLIESVNKSKLWEKSEEADKLIAKKKSPLPGLIALLIGVICVLFPTVYAAFTKKSTFAREQTNFIILLAGCLFIFTAGFLLFHRRKTKRNTVVEITVDADDITNRLEGVIKEIDDVLALRKKDAAGTAQAISTAINDDEIKLFSYLLEAKYSGDAEFINEHLEQVESYLAKMDILTVDYKLGTEKYFEFLDGDETKTIRPALLKGGKVLAEGLAQVKVNG